MATMGVPRTGEGPAARRSKAQSALSPLSAFAAALFCLSALAFAPAARAEMSAEASITATQVGTGEPFRLTVQVVSDENSDNLPWPQVENLAPFKVSKEASKSRSAQTTIVNGKVSQRNLHVTQFTYTLTAKTPGTYTIGPIRYVHKGFDKLLGSASVTVAKQEPGLTTEATVSKQDVYLGEQVLYNLRIVHGPGVQQINLVEDLQKLIGEKFWFQKLDKNVEAKTVKINGQNARVFDVRIVLFPLLHGPVELPGIPVEYQQLSRTQRRRSGSVFDMFEDEFFGGGSVVNLSTTSDPVSLQVSPLPQGAPAGFGGAVGSYSLTASVDKNTLPSGDALALTVAIRGNGQPKAITKPALPDLGQFEVFDPEVSTATAIQGGTLVTTKTFKYVMVPRRKGEYNIGPVSFPYFDPARKAYAEARSQPITLSVTQGKEIAAGPGRVMSQREIADIGSDIRHIKIDASALEDGTDFLYKHVWFWSLFPPAPVAFALMLLLRRRSRRLESDATLKRKSLAGAQLRRRLKEANEALKGQNPREFYKALSQAVVGFASDKTNVEFRGLPLEDAKAALRKQGAGDGTAQEYEKLIERCDFGQFAGGGKDEKGWKEALAAAEDLLRRMEKEL